MPDAPKKPRKKTRYWEDDNGWNYEVIHPDGHTAAGAFFKTKAAAQKAAKQVRFG